MSVLRRNHVRVRYSATFLCQREGNAHEKANIFLAALLIGLALLCAEGLMKIPQS